MSATQQSDEAKARQRVAALERLVVDLETRAQAARNKHDNYGLIYEIARRAGQLLGHYGENMPDRIDFARINNELSRLIGLRINIDEIMLRIDAQSAEIARLKKGVSIAQTAEATLKELHVQIAERDKQIEELKKLAVAERAELRTRFADLQRDHDKFREVATAATVMSRDLQTENEEINRRLMDMTAALREMETITLQIRARLDEYEHVNAQLKAQVSGMSDPAVVRKCEERLQRAIAETSQLRRQLEDNKGSFSQLQNTNKALASQLAGIQRDFAQLQRMSQRDQDSLVDLQHRLDQALGELAARPDDAAVAVQRQALVAARQQIAALQAVAPPVPIVSQMTQEPSAIVEKEVFIIEESKDVKKHHEIVQVIKNIYRDYKVPEKEYIDLTFDFSVLKTHLMGLRKKYHVKTNFYEISRWYKEILIEELPKLPTGFLQKMRTVMHEQELTEWWARLPSTSK